MPRTLLGPLAVLLLLLAAASTPAAPVPATVQGVEAVNVRRGPGLDSAAFVYLPRGTAVQVDEISGQWARVTLANGETGYINAAYLKAEPGMTLPLATASMRVSVVTGTQLILRSATPSCCAIAPTTRRHRSML